MFGFFKKKNPPAKTGETAVALLAWRNHMWVVTPDGLGIIFKLGTETQVHLVDTNGHTVADKVYPITALRQAKFVEIPKCRLKCTKEEAHSMGYF